MADPQTNPEPDPTTPPTPEETQASDGSVVGAVPADEEGQPVGDDDDPGSGGSEGPPDGSSDAPSEGDRAEEDPSEGADVPGEPDPLTKVRAERDAYLDQLMRARADYDNLNKRRHKEVAEARDRGAATLAEAMLEVLDNFGFALQAAEASEDTQLAKGVELVHSQLLGVLEQAGLSEVPGVGADFDPAHHEALISENDDVERNHPEVAEVLRTGYRFKSQLLRPASVKVVE